MGASPPLLPLVAGFDEAHLPEALGLWVQEQASHCY